METKASLRRILWSLTYLILAVLGVRVAQCTAPAVSASPERDRIVVRKPWAVEPVRVVAAKTRKKGEFQIGKAFDDDDNWLEGFTVTVRNDSDKVVTAVVVEMAFPRDSGDTRNKFVQDLHFGPGPTTPAYLRRDPNKVIRPGESGDLELKPQTYKSMTVALQQFGYSTSIKTIELKIREVGFEDGGVLLSGTWYIQDPNNPSDPSRKIPAARKLP